MPQLFTPASKGKNKKNYKYSANDLCIYLSFFQVFNIVIWLFGITVIISKIFDINQKDLLTVLGAISALIILIFRDTILGFVASVQVASYDMVRVGDWITIKKLNVDPGDLQCWLGPCISYKPDQYFL